MKNVFIHLLSINNFSYQSYHRVVLRLKHKSGKVRVMLLLMIIVLRKSIPSKKLI